MRNILLKGLALGLLLTTSARSATNVIDFNTNPTNNPIYSWHGNVVDTSNNPAPWRPTGGASGGVADGYLAITDARSGSSSSLVFKDFESGLIVKAFSFECDLRIGGGTANPADGFAITLAAQNDPAVAQADNNQTPTIWNGTGDDGLGNGGAGAESNLPEEGAQTGLAIGFDAWQSGTLFGGQDIVGISVRLNTALLAQLPVPITPGNLYTPGEPVPVAGPPGTGPQGTNFTYNPVPYRNLATNDANYPFSLQTGARNASVTSDTQPLYGSTNYNDWIQNLKFEHFKTEVTEDLKLHVYWKGFNSDGSGGNELTPPGGLDVSLYAPQAVRIVLAGRTGGAWQVMHLDNMKLVTIPFAGAAITSFRGNAGGFVVQVKDQGGATLNTGSVQLTLNGTAVTPVTPIPRVASGTNGVIDTSLLIYKASPLLTPGTTYTVNISYTDSGGGTVAGAVRKFVAGSYTTIPPEYAVTGIDTSMTGFKVFPHQIPRPRGPGDANTIAMAERQIAGGFIDPSTGQPYVNTIIPGTTGPASNNNDNDGTFDMPVINWNVDPIVDYGSPLENTTAADAGNFQTGSGYPKDVPDVEIPALYGGLDQANPTVPGYNENIVVEANAYLDLPAGFYTFGVNSDDGFRVSVARAPGDVLGLNLGSFNGGRGANDSLFDVYVPTAGIFPVRLLWWQGGGGAECEFFYVDPDTSQRVLFGDNPSVPHTLGSAYPNAFQAYLTTANSAVRPHVSRVSPEPGQSFVFADADVQAWITNGTTIAVDPATVSLTVNGTTVTGAISSTGGTTIKKAGGSLSNLLRNGANTNVLVYSYTDGGNAVNVTNTWTFNVTPYTITIPAANAVASGVDLTTIGFKALVNQIDRSLNTNTGEGRTLFSGDQNRMPRPEIQLANGNINPTNGQPYPNLVAGGVTDYDLGGALNFNVNGGPPVAVGNSGIFNGDKGMPGLPGTGTSFNGVENYVAEFRTYLDLKGGVVYQMAVNSDDGFVVSSAPNPRDTLGTVLGFFNGGRGNAGTLPTPGTAVPIPNNGSFNGRTVFSFGAPADGIYPFRILYWQGGGGVNIEFSSIDRNSGLSTLIGDTNLTSVSWTNVLPIKAYRNYTGAARPWVKFAVSPEPWDYRVQQGGPGPILTYGRTRNSATSDDIYNDADNRLPWADTTIGGVIASLGAGTASLLLDGTAVPATSTPSGSDTLVSYKPPTALPSGTTHTASLVYAGTTNSWTFTVQSYTNVPASAVLPLSSADPNSRGFKVKVRQTTVGQNNTVAGAEALLAGLVANVAVPGTNSDGTYTFPGIINWNNNLNSTNLGGLPIIATGTQIGNFQKNDYGSGWPFGDYLDVPLPGCPGTNLVNCDNSAAEVFAYLSFTNAGYYRFGVNSDDGFALKVGTPGVTNGLALASFDVGKGASDIPFSFTVPQAGLVPIRLVYYNGGGGANLEFFSYDDTGKKIPINDAASPIKAYYNVTTTAQPMFTSAAVDAGQLTLNWSGTGSVIVQSATALTGNPADWTDGPTITGNTYSVGVGAGNKFYRLKSAP
jgi:hypothetical protein